MLTLLLHAVLSGAVAYVWAAVLPAPGMLLYPLRHRWAMWYEARYTRREQNHFPNLLDAAWFKPLWGCALCCSGQFAFWAYLYHTPAYHWWEHAYCVAVGILTAQLLSKHLS